MTTIPEGSLGFVFRDRIVPVTHASSISKEDARLALDSEVFRRWATRCEKQMNGEKRLELHSVELQNVDMFGPRVGFVKINADCTLVDGTTHHEHRLPGICFLRGSSVAILVALICEEEEEGENGEVYSLLVEQPRVPIGQVSCLELPAGMIDKENDGVKGTAAKEIEEECGIKLRASDLTDLTELSCQQAVEAGYLPCAGIAPSPGGCDEFIRYMYVEHVVNKADLDRMKGRLAGLREHGEFITLRVVKMKEMWKISCDNKVICALFLAEQLRREGKLPTVGGLVKPVKDPTHCMCDGTLVPSLAFGLYKVPADEDGERIIGDAIMAGYRHFDTASLYQNERILGQAIKKSGIPRKEFIVCSKVWNDAQIKGREAVRQSVERSVNELEIGYIDILYVHWPVPGHFIETYRELQDLCREKIIKSIGLSNFSINDYEELLACKDDNWVQPIVNQMEVSPFMYRPATIQFFQDRNIQVAASKALHRAIGIEEGIVKSIADSHGVTTAQVMLRWSFQKRLIVVAKTANADRMNENRHILHFSLTDEEMTQLDSLTSEEDIRTREELEIQRRRGV